jgi:hypothetical protein
MWDLRLSTFAVQTLREIRNNTENSESRAIADWFLNGLIEGIYDNGHKLALEDYSLYTLCRLANAHLILTMRKYGERISFDCFGQYVVRVKYQLPETPLIEDMGDGQVRPVFYPYPRDFNSWLCKTLEPIIEIYGKHSLHNL